jgi:hypothetical protein
VGREGAARGDRPRGFVSLIGIERWYIEREATRKRNTYTQTFSHALRILLRRLFWEMQRLVQERSVNHVFGIIVPSSQQRNLDIIYIGVECRFGVGIRGEER